MFWGTIWWNYTQEHFDIGTFTPEWYLQRVCEIPLCKCTGCTWFLNLIWESNARPVQLLGWQRGWVCKVREENVECENQQNKEVCSDIFICSFYISVWCINWCVVSFTEDTSVGEMVHPKKYQKIKPEQNHSSFEIWLWILSSSCSPNLVINSDLIKQISHSFLNSLQLSWVSSTQ